MKTFNINSDEIVYGTVNQLVVLSEFQNILRNGNESNFFKGITIQAQTIEGIKNDNQLKNLIISKKALEFVLRDKLNEHIYNYFYDYDKIFYRVIKREDDFNPKDNSVMLSFIAVNENKNGSYLVLSYEDIDKSCVIATEYKTVGKTVLNSHFAYDELVKFLGSSEYKVLEIKEKNDLIEDEKFDFIETIIKEILEKLNILDFEEFNVEPMKIKDLTNIKDDLENYKNTSKR